MLLAIVLAAAFVGSLLMTPLLRKYALSRGLMDVPNARSLHAVPTPRGGGIAIVACVLGLTAGLSWADLVPTNVAIAMIGGGVVVAFVGWLDDHKPLSNRIRLAVWFPAAAWAVFWVGGLPDVQAGDATIHLGWVGAAIAVVAVVWSINFYNFMDGSDGLAGSEGLIVAGAAATLLSATGAGALAVLAVTLAGSCGGFLVWNWAPARVFMGDVGSGFLGFAFAILAIASENAHTLPLTSWLLLLAVFWLDATLTLVRRVVTGQRWHQAHRTHAYQLLARSGWSHSRVALAVAILNVALAGLAWLAMVHRQAAPLALIGASLVIGGIWGMVTWTHRRLIPPQPA